MIKGTDITGIEMVKIIPCSPPKVKVTYKVEGGYKTAFVDNWTVVKALQQFVYFEPNSIINFLDINFAETEIMNGKGRG